uniref:Cilia- and flagella-associated protein 97 n=1 Tax=Nothobranchius kuhntae TaxID=321403 RepID=A0A1A8HUM0_NOTKU
MSLAESDDTITDVSPLSSPELSPCRSVNLPSEMEERTQEQESVPSSGLSSMHLDDDSDQDLDERSFNLESSCKPKRGLCHPGWRNRKNYTFSNDEVRRIERENSRLLRELTSPASATVLGKAPVKKTCTSNFPVTQMAHNAIRRQREQQRIERENLLVLKKLESVKPTPGLSRSEQLADYQRLTGRPAASSRPSFRPSTNRGRSSSRTSTAFTHPRPGSSRSSFTNTSSSSTPAPGSKTPKFSPPT